MKRGRKPKKKYPIEGKVQTMKSLTKDYDTVIAKIEKKHGLNPDAKEDFEALILKASKPSI